jgi:hypothetical protein
MFHLTESQVNRLHEDIHDRAIDAAQDGNTARAEALQEAAKMLHEARMQAYDQRAATARRREQRQFQGAAR